MVSLTTTPLGAALRIVELALDLGAAPIQWPLPLEARARLDDGDALTLEAALPHEVRRTPLTAADLAGDAPEVLVTLSTPPTPKPEPVITPPEPAPKLSRKPVAAPNRAKKRKPSVTASPRPAPKPAAAPAPKPAKPREPKKPAEKKDADRMFRL